MSENQSSAPVAETPSISDESVSEEKVASSEAPQAESKADAKVEAIAEKAASGEKLTKKEEKTLKEYRLKVNGREEVIKFDPNNDEEVKNWLQKGRASDAKFAEAAEVRKAAMSFIEELKKNPKRVLADPNIGIDVKKFAEEIMSEHIKELELSPEQRELNKLKKELEDIKTKKDKDEQEFKAKEQARLQAENERYYETEISAALDVSGLPKTPKTVDLMAHYMMIALQNGINLSPKDIAPIVKDYNMREFKTIISSLSDDQMEDFLGKEVIGRLRKKNVAKAKAIDNSVKPTGTSEAKSVQKEEAPQKKMSIRDFLGT